MSQKNSVETLVKQVRLKCCKKIQNLYSKIQLLNRQQINVDQLYVDVYVLEKLASEFAATIPSLLEGSNLLDDFDRLGLGKRGKRSPGLSAVTLYSRLIVLGKPGSGKSTFLRHLAILNCKGEFLESYIPVFIELRFIKNFNEFNLLNYIYQEFRLADQMQSEQILDQGKVLFLLDGLDEVPSQWRRKMQDHIIEFSRHYYKNHFILTCRTQTSEYTLPIFNYVEVANFNLTQVESFAHNWFISLAETPKQGLEVKQKFIAKLKMPENKQIFELAVTPILLSLTCWVFNDLQAFPPKHSDLYERGINILLEKWDEKRGIKRECSSDIYRKLTVKQRIKLLSYIAKCKFEQEQYILFEGSEIKSYITEYLSISPEDAEAVLLEIEAQHGLFVERAQGIWSFSHLTFQEYFTAKWFVESGDFHILANHIVQPHWREVFLLVVIMTSKADEILSYTNHIINYFLAEDDKLQYFLNWLFKKAKSVDTPCKPAEVRAFYFVLARALIYAQTSAYTMTRGLALSFANAVGSSTNITNISAFNVDLALAHAHDQAYNNYLSSTQDLNFDFNNPHILNTVPKLYQKLEEITKELPVTSDEEFQAWWKAKGKTWTEKLRLIMIKYRNIGHDWRFSDIQLKLLRTYYNANQVLLDCLNSGCVVSDKVRNQIEETFLSPIKQIEKLKDTRRIE